MAPRFLTLHPAGRDWLPEPLHHLQREIDRVFDDVFSGAGRSGSGWASTSPMRAPRIDLQDADGELRLHADLPGIEPSDLDVRVEGDVLTIRGERKHESDRNEQNFHVMERSHGRFQRSIQLPFAPDPEQVHAAVRHGVLEIRIPKRAPQERSRRIEVRGGDAQPGIGAQQGIGTQGIGTQGAALGGGAAMAQAVGGGASSSETGSSDDARSGSDDAGRAGSTGQGPGGTSSVTPGVGGGAQGGRGSEGGLAGTSGGPTSGPAGETAASG